MLSSLPSELILIIAQEHNYVNHKLRVTCKRYYELLPSIPRCPSYQGPAYIDIITCHPSLYNVFRGDLKNASDDNTFVVREYERFLQDMRCECCLQHGKVKYYPSYVGTYVFYFICVSCRVHMMIMAIKHRLTAHVLEIVMEKELSFWCDPDPNSDPDDTYTWTQYKVRDDVKSSSQWNQYTEDCKHLIVWERIDSA